MSALIRMKRLMKEQQSLEREPLENAFVKRQGQLNFYFCLYYLEDDFKDGFYFGLLELHSNYPFSAPKLIIYTPNGRYDINLPICTSFTNYHQQSWTSAWNVRTLIQATISFMYSNEPSYGCRSDDSLLRKKYARQSLKWNMQNQQFKKLFGQTIKQKLPQLIKKGIVIYNPEIFSELGNSQKQLIKLNNSSIEDQIDVKSNRKNIYPDLEQQIFELNDLKQQLLQDYAVLDENTKIFQSNKRNLQNRKNQEEKRKRDNFKRDLKIVAKIAVAAAAVGVICVYLISRFSGSSSSSEASKQVQSSVYNFFKF